MSVSKRLRETLDSHAIKYVVITHSQAFTAQEIAARMHVPGRELAKTVVLRGPNGLALAVVRAQDRVDADLAGGLLGTKVRVATEPEFAGSFPDCEAGAMPPFGNLYGLPTLVDEELSKDAEIVFNAGTHVEAIRMSYADYAACARPRVGRIASSAVGSAR
jgi:Ala-tRNA(Pro) deacylase